MGGAGTCFGFCLPYHPSPITHDLSLFYMKDRRLDVDGAAGGAFAGFREAVALPEDEPAVPAGSRDHGEAAATLAQGLPQVFEVVADVPLGYFDDA